MNKLVSLPEWRAKSSVRECSAPDAPIVESVAVAVLILILAVSEVVEDLGNEKDLNDLLDDNGDEPGGTPEVVAEFYVFVPHPQVVSECVPALVEWSKDSEDDKSPQNAQQGLIINE